MNFIRRIRDYFRSDYGPRLRNKPGGLAWINKGIDEGDGAAVLVNRVVRTVRVKDGDFWDIDPPQVYQITAPARNKYTGTVFPAGTWVRSISIRDHCLTPIPDVGDSEQDESAQWLPPVPSTTEKPQEVPT